MNAIVTRIFALNDEKIREFMRQQGYDKDDYTEDEIIEALNKAEALGLETSSNCEIFKTTNVEMDN